MDIRIIRRIAHEAVLQLVEEGMLAEEVPRQTSPLDKQEEERKGNDDHDDENDDNHF